MYRPSALALRHCRGYSAELECRCWDFLGDLRKASRELARWRVDTAVRRRRRCA